MALNNDIAIAPKLREEMALRDKALAGDIVFVVTPETVDRTATSDAWTRTVVVELQTSAGEVHTWLDKAITSGVSIEDDSTEGTASITSTTLNLEKGRAEIVVSGDAEDWVDEDTNTLTVAEATILGYTVASKTSVETIVAE